MMRSVASSFVFAVFICSLFATASARTYEPYRLDAEPSVRIGLSTNARSVAITTGDTSLVSVSPDEPARLLGSTRVSVSIRSYRPPEVETYRIEFQNLPTREDADAMARDIRAATGETAIVSIDTVSNTWKIWVGKSTTSDIEIDELKARLADKGFEDAVVAVERKAYISAEAVALTEQLRSTSNSDVRSLVKPTSNAQPVAGAAVDPNLREVLVNSPAGGANFSSLKAIAFGSVNERANPVRLDGKAYRGKIEVFVNSRGTLTVVNVVPLEDYLLGVVPSELGLPQLEAQKAQAVAARTYAVANIGGYARQGFDMLPTVSSQVYKGVSAETRMGTMAVQQTRGIVATYNGKPIMAYYTSTCGGRTESSENIFGHAEPYLVGVECSLEGRRHFEPFLIKTSRMPAKVRDDANLDLVRSVSLLAANGYLLPVVQITDEWLDDVPTETELANWLGNLAALFGKQPVQVTRATAMPLELARVIAGFAFPPGTADTLLTESDINYQLAFDDSAQVPREQRADLAALMRDGLFMLNSDMTLQPGRPFTRGRMIRLITQIYARKKWTPETLTGKAKPTTDGRLVLASGKSERQVTVRPDVFLFREFGSRMYPVREAALVGGESVAYQLDALGAVKYLEIRPSESPTTAENMSPWVLWNKTASAAEVQSRLSRYVRGIGTLYDVNVKAVGYSRRPIELEIIGSNGIRSLKGGKIRSALRLPEQLFVMNKRYSGSQVVSYTFTGRGWGHGVGMCQYGAFGLARMGVKYDEIIKHYYTGVELTKAY